MEKLLKVLTDPVSNRILQMIRVRKTMTISDILAENTQVPRATVYRKIDKMLDVGAIYVADTNKVRGQTENVYSIKEMYISNPKSNEDSMRIVTVSLMQIIDLYDTTTGKISDKIEVYHKLEKMNYDESEIYNKRDENRRL